MQVDPRNQGSNRHRLLFDFTPDRSCTSKQVLKCVSVDAPSAGSRLQRRRIIEERPEPAQNQGFRIVGRNTPKPSARCHRCIPSRDIIMVSFCSLRRLSGSHGPAKTVEQQPAEQVRVSQNVVMLACSAVAGQLCLDRIPDLCGDNPLVFAGEVPRFMPNSADIYYVDEKMRETAARARDASASPSAFVCVEFRRRTISVE